MNKRLIAVSVLLVLFTGLFAGCKTAEGLYIAQDGTYYRDSDGKNHVGFLETEDGVMFFQEDGKKVDDGLITWDGELYCMRAGFRVVGWQDLSDLGHGTYYFDASGRAVRGEQEIDGKKYAFDPDTAELIGEAEKPAETSPSTTPEPPASSPEATPETTPAITPDAPSKPSPDQPDKPAGGSAATGALTGDDKLDKAVKEVIDSVCSADNSPEENLGAVFDWMVKKLKYKYVAVDLSNGYTDELVNSLAEYIILNRRGSCEHEAALMDVFASRLGCESQVVAGKFLSDDKSEWVEHAWVIAKVGDSYYHFDPLYGRNHTGGKPRTFFMKKDADIEAVHQWDREAYPACD